MEHLITCINCPVGCRMQVAVEGGEVVSISGNSCNRGITYAKQECIAPLRMVTAVVTVIGSKLPVSVKTSSPIPKEKIFDVMQQLGKLKVQAPVAMGQIICANVCATGVDVIATKAVGERGGI